jgi:hypothetical protein
MGGWNIFIQTRILSNTVEKLFNKLSNIWKQ